MGEVANCVVDGEIAFVANLGDQEALVAALDAVLGDWQRAAAVGAAGAALA